MPTPNPLRGVVHPKVNGTMSAEYRADWTGRLRSLQVHTGVVRFNPSATGVVSQLASGPQWSARVPQEGNLGTGASSSLVVNSALEQSVALSALRPRTRE
eukprot:5840801-Prymnesium_polylepis.1